MFVFNLANGDVVVYDHEFKKLFNIPPMQTNIKRQIITLQNPQKNNESGNFVLLTDGTDININIWCNLNK